MRQAELREGSQGARESIVLQEEDSLTPPPMRVIPRTWPKVQPGRPAVPRPTGTI